MVTLKEGRGPINFSRPQAHIDQRFAKDPVSREAKLSNALNCRIFCLGVSHLVRPRWLASGREWGRGRCEGYKNLPPGVGEIQEVLSNRQASARVCNQDGEFLAMEGPYSAAWGPSHSSV